MSVLEPWWCTVVEALCVQSVMYEAFKGGPLTIDLDTTKLQDGLCAFLDPPHAAVIASAPDDVLDGSLDCTGADLEVTPS